MELLTGGANQVQVLALQARPEREPARACTHNTSARHTVLRQEQVILRGRNRSACVFDDEWLPQSYALVEVIWADLPWNEPCTDHHRSPSGYDSMCLTKKPPQHLYTPYDCFALPFGIFLGAAVPSVFCDYTSRRTVRRTSDPRHQMCSVSVAPGEGVPQIFLQRIRGEGAPPMAPHSHRQQLKTHQNNFEPMISRLGT